MTNLVDVPSRVGRNEYLVEKDVLAISTFCGKVLEVAILTDSMLLAKLLPELAPDCDYFSEPSRIRSDSES